MSLKFKYRSLPSSGDAPYPALPILLYNGKKQISVDGLLDSGSTDTLIPSDIAEILGLELLDSEKIEMINGSKMTMKKAFVGISLGRGASTFRMNFTVYVGDAKDVLIGRTFFRYFDITFKESNQEISLKRLEDKTRIERAHRYLKKMG